MGSNAVLLDIKADWSELPLPQLPRVATPMVRVFMGQTDEYERALHDLMRRIDLSLEPLRVELAEWRMAAATIFWQIEDGLPENP